MPDFVACIEQFLSTFSPDEVAVMRQAFQRILRGRPARCAEVASALGMPVSAVEAIVARLGERGTMSVDAETGEIVGARGLSLRPTPNRLLVNDQPLYTFCAVDAVGIPAGLEVDARVESHCHACGAPLVVTLTKDDVIQAPSGTVVWATERDLSRPLHTHT